MFSSGNNGDKNKPNVLSSNLFSNIGSGGLFGNLLNNNKENNDSNKKGLGTGLFDLDINKKTETNLFSSNNTNSLFSQDNKGNNLYEPIKFGDGSLFGNNTNVKGLFGLNNNNTDNNIFSQIKDKEEKEGHKNIKKANDSQFPALFKNEENLSLGKELSLGNKDENFFNDFNNNNIQENSNNTNYRNEINIEINYNKINFNDNNNNENNNNNYNNDNNNNNNNDNDDEVEENIGDKKEKEIEKIIKISEELNQPDELDSNSNNNDYIDIINQKIKKYKRELDSKVDKIEANKKELIEH